MKMYVERHGQGSPLFCLHNFSANSRDRFYPLLPILQEHYECFLVDLRGHGRSDNPSGKWTHEQSARDVIELLDQLGLERVRVLATSSGAMTMLRVAQYAPNRIEALVLDSTTYRVPPEARGYYKDPMTLSPKLVQYYKKANEVYGENYWSVLAQTFYDFRLPECDINIPLENLKKIVAPTLIIAGDRDFFFPIDIHVEMKQMIPTSELLVVPNTAHIVMEDHPLFVADQAIAFFQRAEKKK